MSTPLVYFRIISGGDAVGVCEESASPFEDSAFI